MSHRSKNARTRRRRERFAALAAEQGLTLEQWQANRAQECAREYAQRREQEARARAQRAADLAVARDRVRRGTATLAEFMDVHMANTMDFVSAAWERRLIHGSRADEVVFDAFGQPVTLG